MLLAATILFAMASAPSVALAANAASDRQRELMGRARSAERAADPARAAELYRRARGAAPGSRLARRAEVRLGWLEARSEGGWAPLADLMAMRSRRTAQLTAPLVAGFAERARGFPDGLVKREAYHLVADAYLHQLRMPAAASPAYEAWAGLPGVTPGERHLALSGAAMSRARLGQLRAAVDCLERAGLGDRPETRYFRATLAGKALRYASVAALAGFAAMVLAFGRWRAIGLADLARAFSAPRLGALCYAAGVPVAILQLYDPSLADDLALALAPCAAVAAVASLSGIALAKARAGAFRFGVVATAAALAGVAAGCLGLDASGLLIWLTTTPWRAA